MLSKGCNPYYLFENKSDLNMEVGRQQLFVDIWKTWWKITTGELVIEKGDRIGMLYLCPHNTDYFVFVDSIETGAVLWNHRLGHMSQNGM